MDLELYFEKIEAFIENRLSLDERKAFEKELNTIPELKSEVVKHILAKEAIGLTLEDDIRGNLEKVKAEAHKASAQDFKQKSKTRRLFTPIRVAAGILILVVAAWVFTELSQHSTNTLTTNYYQEASTSTLMGSGSSDINMENGQIALFKEKDAAKASSIFSQIPENDPNYLTAQYFLGHSFFKQKAYSQSAKAFEFVYLTKDLPAFISREEVQWNWLLAKLGTGAEEEVENTLDQILKNEDGPYYSKAEQLREKLSSIWR